jgi:DNA-binding XRE family transcriptional regulator
MVNLRAMREKRKMTQQELANRAGIPQQTIAAIETGIRKNPGVMTLFPICNVLKCTIDDLIVEDEKGA